MTEQYALVQLACPFCDQLDCDHDFEVPDYLTPIFTHEAAAMKLRYYVEQFKGIEKSGYRRKKLLHGER